MVKKLDKNPTKTFLKKWLSRQSSIYLVQGILFLIASLLLFFNPTAAGAIIVSTLGIAFLLFGLMGLVRSFVNRDFIPNASWNMAFSVINMIIGIVLISIPSFSLSVFLVIAFAVFLIKSVQMFLSSVKLIKHDGFGGAIGLIASIISILFSLLIIFRPGVGVYMIVYYIAAGLLFYAISDFFMAYRTGKIKKNI